MVFDLGLHKGEDTAYYLALGYSVIAFEADPYLVDRAKSRFREAIEAGRLTIVAGAVSEAEGEITFYTNPSARHFGTVSPDWRKRNETQGKPHEAVTVKAVPFKDQLVRFGMPYFMKIDIEGADTLCLEALAEFEGRPRYISIESDKTDWAALEREIDLLEGLGYTRFKAVQQRFIPGRSVTAQALNGKSVSHTFEPGASGPFGDDLLGAWMTKDAVLHRYEGIFAEYGAWGDESVWKRNRLLKALLDAWEMISRTPYPGWYDTHASRD